uniref:Uncharacterized protein n=1 Tax=Arundo donax TaxID=35708 RepID=A0A0A9FMV8_ARUDO
MRSTHQGIATQAQRPKSYGQNRNCRSTA